jgi:hypothetical protein
LEGIWPNSEPYAAVQTSGLSRHLGLCSLRRLCGSSAAFSRRTLHKHKVDRVPARKGCFNAFMQGPALCYDLSKIHSAFADCLPDLLKP